MLRRHFPMSPSPSSSVAGRVASRVIRFVDERGVTRCGQPEGPAAAASSALLVEGDDPLGSRVLTGERATVAKLLAPVAPSQILGIGLNYRQHAKETGMPEPRTPVLFTKGVNALQHPNGPIVIPRVAADPPEVDYECELAVVLQRDAKDVSEQDALAYVAGYTAANDVSSRKWQLERGGGQWCRSKTFDTFCPLGPELVTTDEIRDPQNLAISTRLNGRLMQSSNTGDMIFSVAKIISELSKDATLPRGTVIITGTPEGVGFARSPPVFLKPGDVVEIEIEKIGKLVNRVEAASSL